MKKSGDICFEIFGPLAMFTTPHSRLNCECISYPYPTYSSLCGMLRMIYNRKGIIWVPDKCRVMNEIKNIGIAKKTPSYMFVKDAPPQRLIHTYLEDVRYQVKAHYIMDYAYMNSPDLHLRHDYDILAAIGNGGSNVISLGRRECAGIIRACEWGSGDGYYDGSGLSEPIHMFHSFQYTTRKNGHIDAATFCLQSMEDGVISFDEKMPKVTRRWRE